MNAQVLGISVDHVPGLQAWAETFGGISYPLLSDFWPHGEVAARYGVLGDDGRAERAIFIVDADGILQYAEVYPIDEQPDNEILFRELKKLQPEGSSEFAEEPEAEPLPSGGIVMYCTKWCKDCPRARVWMKEHGVTFQEVDIYAVRGAWAQVKQWAGGRIVTPTFNIDGHIFLDFDETTFPDILRETGYLDA